MSLISPLNCNVLTVFFLSEHFAEMLYSYCEYKHGCEINGPLNIFVCSCLFYVMDSIPGSEREMNFFHIIPSARVW
jgi:hypothetical protein